MLHKRHNFITEKLVCVLKFAIWSKILTLFLGKTLAMQDT